MVREKLPYVFSSEARNRFIDLKNEISPRFVVTERAQRVEMLVAMTSGCEFISNLLTSGSSLVVIFLQSR